MSGTIGGVGNNGAGMAGVNWTASMGLKFLSATGSGSTSDAIEAIEFAIQAKAALGVDANVRVLSNSWGGGGATQALLDEINKANTANMIFLAAAGNSAVNIDTTPFYPAAYNAPNVVSVAATDNDDNIASFSNYGVTNVDLAAPGVNIYSTVLGTGYAWYQNGTSMATPHVSGAAALILAACPTLTTAQLKSSLLSSVDAVPALATRVATGGRLNVNRAVRACATPPTVPAAPTSLTATAGNARVTLAWPAVTGAASYKVLRGTVIGTYAQIAAGVTTTGYVDTAVSTGRTYQLRGGGHQLGWRFAAVAQRIGDALRCADGADGCLGHGGCNRHAPHYRRVDGESWRHQLHNPSSDDGHRHAVDDWHHVRDLADQHQSVGGPDLLLRGERVEHLRDQRELCAGQRSCPVAPVRTRGTRRSGRHARDRRGPDRIARLRTPFRPSPQTTAVRRTPRLSFPRTRRLRGATSSPCSRRCRPQCARSGFWLGPRPVRRVRQPPALVWST